MKWLEEMSPRQREIFLRNVGKSNPPRIFNRYRRASEWAIKELTVPEVHVAGVVDMNDPFEYRAPLFISIAKLRAAMYRFSRGRGMSHEEATVEAQSVGHESVARLQQALDGKLRQTSGLI